jgi:hypothetical protein
VSSAILYLAIVVIWACVLIPRWLRRDSARGASNEPDATISGDTIVAEDVPDDSVSRDDVRTDTVSARVPGRLSNARTVPGSRLSLTRAMTFLRCRRPRSRDAGCWWRAVACSA